jgi:hypothetical protein
MKVMRSSLLLALDWTGLDWTGLESGIEWTNWREEGSFARFCGLVMIVALLCTQARDVVAIGVSRLFKQQ